MPETAPPPGVDPDNFISDDFLAKLDIENLGVDDGFKEAQAARQPAKEEPAVEPEPEVIADDTPDPEAEKPDPAKEEKPDAEKDKDADTEDEPEPSLEEMLADEGEKKPADDDGIPDAVKEQGEKAVETWGTLKAKAKQLDEVTAELDKLKSAGTSREAGETITKLTEELEAAQRQLYAVNFTSDPDYQREVLAPLKTAKDDARVAVLSADMISEDSADDLGLSIEGITLDVLAERIEDALEITDDVARTRAVKSITRYLDSQGQIDALSAAARVRDLARTHRQFEEKAPELRKQLDEARQIETQQQIAARQKAERETSGDVWEKFEKAMPFIKDEEGNLKEEFQEVAALRDVLTEEQSPATIAAGKFATPMLVRVLKLRAEEAKTHEAAIKERETKIKELEDAIEETSGVRPGAGAGKKGSAEKVADDGSGFSDAFERIRAGESVTFQ